MVSDYDKDAQNYLEINVEMQKDKSIIEGLEDKITQNVIKILLDSNSEYEILHSSNPDKLIPKIVLWPNGDRKYFGGKGKQKWVNK